MTTTPTEEALPVLLPFEPPLNRDGSQTTEPQTRYPFDLTRALAGDPVITRDGQLVKGLTLAKFNAKSCGDLSGQLNNGYTWWQQSGRFYADTESPVDLFMATPAKGGAR